MPQGFSLFVYLSTLSVKWNPKIFLKKSSINSVNKNLQLEILALASQGMKNIIIETTSKDDHDIFEENYIPKQVYKLTTYTKNEKVFEEKYFDYFEERVKNCLEDCDVNMYWRAYLKMKYSPSISKIKLTKGTDILLEETIRPYEVKLISRR